MRECWVNVFKSRDGNITLGKFRTPLPREFNNDGAVANITGVQCVYRIHAKLKPEGAPKRYCSEGDRWVWETSGAWTRSLPAGTVLKVSPTGDRVQGGDHRNR